MNDKLNYIDEPGDEFELIPGENDPIRFTRNLDPILDDLAKLGHPVQNRGDLMEIIDVLNQAGADRTLGDYVREEALAARRRITK